MLLLLLIYNNCKRIRFVLKLLLRLAQLNPHGEFFFFFFLTGWVAAGRKMRTSLYDTVECHQDCGGRRSLFIFSWAFEWWSKFHWSFSYKNTIKPKLKTPYIPRIAGWFWITYLPAEKYLWIAQARLEVLFSQPIRLMH